MPDKKIIANRLCLSLCPLCWFCRSERQKLNTENAETIDGTENVSPFG